MTREASRALRQILCQLLGLLRGYPPWRASLEHGCARAVRITLAAMNAPLEPLEPSLGQGWPDPTELDRVWREALGVWRHALEVWRKGPRPDSNSDLVPKAGLQHTAATEAVLASADQLWVAGLWTVAAHRWVLQDGLLPNWATSERPEPPWREQAVLALLHLRHEDAQDAAAWLRADRALAAVAAFREEAAADPTLAVQAATEALDKEARSLEEAAAASLRPLPYTKEP